MPYTTAHTPMIAKIKTMGFLPLFMAQLLASIVKVEAALFPTQHATSPDNLPALERIVSPALQDFLAPDC